MKYTFSIENDGKIVLESRAGESDRHIALKLLAYLLFRDEADGLPLRIEQGVGQRHKPDLVATDPDTGAVRLWIDCGDIGVKRLGRIAGSNKGARIIVVKATAGEALAYARAAGRFLPPPAERAAPVVYAGFDEDFLPSFLRALRGRNDVSLSRQDVAARVEINGETLRTALFLRAAEDV